VASVLIYRSGQQALRDREEATAKLIQTRYQESRRKERDRLDPMLPDKAADLARNVHLRLDHDQLRLRHLHVLGAWLAGMTPNGAMAMPMTVWIAQGAPSPFTVSLYQGAAFKLEFRPDPEPSGQPPWKRPTGEYFQVNAIYRGRSYKALHQESPAPGRFPDITGFAPDKPGHSEMDDYKLGDDEVRRVRLKTRIWLTLSQDPPEWWPPYQVAWWPGWGRGPRPFNGGPGGRAGTRAPGRPPPAEGPGSRPRPNPNWWRLMPTVYVQYAVKTHDAEALARADQERTKLARETQEALRRQRNHLLLICGLTFLATGLGSLALVWVGLLPLRRLSDAVSKVSERDFRLPLGKWALPLELRPVGERLTTTLGQLERAFAREKQATADISHELRTPLAAMITMIDLALRKPRSAEQYRELFEDCRTSAKQMHQIVERLLTLARLDAGVDRLRPQTVDVVELAQQCATVVRPLAEARGLQLAVTSQCPVLDTGEHPAQLQTDPDKLREVLNNLLHNAIQYNRPAGRIDVTVARQNGHVRLEVHDTGIGIAPEARERIFERFYRADPSRNADDLHAGLGLAIVKEYVRLMGGQIVVESQEGEGSTFRIDLPVLAPALAG
jgi:signal transduction histidine kinase